MLEGQAVKSTGAYTANQRITVPGGNPAKTGTSDPFTLRDWKLYLKKTAPSRASTAPVAGVQRDMEEGYPGLDPEEAFAARI